MGRIASREQPEQQARLRNARETRSHRLTPDHVTLRARHQAIERGLYPFVLGGIDRLIGVDEGLALAGAADVHDGRRPALRLHCVAGRFEFLDVEPPDDAAERLSLAEPEYVVVVEQQMMH